MTDRKRWKVTGILVLRLSDYMKVTTDEQFFCLCIIEVRVETVQQWADEEEKGECCTHPYAFLRI